MRGADRGMSLERHRVLGLDDARGARERGVRVARDLRLAARRRLRASYVVEQGGGCGERRLGGRRPIRFELPRRLDRLLLALADYGHVVAAAHDPDEPGN